MISKTFSALFHKSFRYAMLTYILRKRDMFPGMKILLHNVCDTAVVCNLPNVRIGFDIHRLFCFVFVFIICLFLLHGKLTFISIHS